MLILWTLGEFQPWITSARFLHRSNLEGITLVVGVRRDRKPRMVSCMDLSCSYHSMMHMRISAFLDHFENEEVEYGRGAYVTGAPSFK